MQVISSNQILSTMVATKQLHPFGAPPANTPQKNIWNMFLLAEEEEITATSVKGDTNLQPTTHKSAAAFDLAFDRKKQKCDEWQLFHSSLPS